jgi:magnesium chelatase subunit I
VMASTSGKIELDTVGDVREEKVVDKLVRQSVSYVFRQYFDVTEFDQLVAGFEKGLNVQVAATQPSMEYVTQLARVGGLRVAVDKLKGHGSPASVASAVEFILEGLHLNKRLNKDEIAGQTRYRRS